MPKLQPVLDPSHQIPARIRVAQLHKRLDPRRLHQIDIEHSQRTAVLTLKSLRWRAAVPADHRPCLQLAVAAVGRLGKASQIVVTLEDDRGPREVFRSRIEAGQGWQSHTVELAGSGDAELVIGSTTRQPVAWSGLSLTWPAPATRPNLILISIDTVRSDHLSCYGYHRLTSPNLDSLAATGVTFANSFSTSTWTLPSTATMLTGLLPDQHGLQGVQDILPSRIEAAAESLSSAGYATVAFTDGGFLGTRWGLSQGFQRYDTTIGKAWEPKDVSVIVSRALSWLRTNRFEPFFLFVHTYEAHQPYTNPEGFADRFLDPAYNGPLSDKVIAMDLLKDNIGDADVAWAEAVYDGEIARADHYLGRLFSALRDLGLGDRTAVLVTSDHGEEFLEHGGAEHGYGKVFDENVRVPLIFRPPGGGDGSVITAPVSSADVVPTLLDLAGLEKPQALTGRSLVQLVDQPANGRSQTVLIHGRNSFSYLNEERYRIDVEKLSLVYDQVRGHADVYDRTNDPQMRRPLRLTSEHDWIADRLQCILAWSSSQGQAFTRLPRVSGTMTVPASSAIQPIGVWQGLSWRPVKVGEAVPLDQRVSASLVFNLEGGDSSALTLDLYKDGGAQEVTLLAKQPPAGWSPLQSIPSGALSLLPTTVQERGNRAEIGKQEREELKTLGYVQ